jgi:hypothetical protein
MRTIFNAIHAMYIIVMMGSFRENCNVQIGLHVT